MQLQRRHYQFHLVKVVTTSPCQGIKQFYNNEHHQCHQLYVPEMNLLKKQGLMTADQSNAETIEGLNRGAKL